MQVESAAAARAEAESGERSAREAQARVEAELNRRRGEGRWLSFQEVEELERQRATLRLGLSTSLAHGREVEAQVEALQRTLRERDSELEAARSAAEEARAAAALAGEDVAAREEQAAELRAQLQVLRGALAGVGGAAPAGTGRAYGSGGQFPRRQLQQSPRRKPGLRRCTPTPRAAGLTGSRPSSAAPHGSPSHPRSRAERAIESPAAVGSTRSGAGTPTGSVGGGDRGVHAPSSTDRPRTLEPGPTPRLQRAQEAALHSMEEAMATAVRGVARAPPPPTLPAAWARSVRRRSRSASAAAASPFASEAAVGHLLRVLTARARAARAEADAGRLRNQVEGARRAQAAAKEEASTLRRVCSVQSEDLRATRVAAAEAGTAARKEEEARVEVARLRSRLAEAEQAVRSREAEAGSLAEQRAEGLHHELQSAKQQAAREAQRADLAASRVRRLEALQEESAAHFMRQQEEAVREVEKDKVCWWVWGRANLPRLARSLHPPLLTPSAATLSPSPVCGRARGGNFPPQERLRRRTRELERDIARLRDQHGTAVRRHVAQMEEMRRELRRQREQGGGGAEQCNEGEDSVGPGALPAPSGGYAHSAAVAGVSDYTEALRQRVEELEQRLREAHARGTTGVRSPAAAAEAVSGPVRTCPPQLRLHLPLPLRHTWPVYRPTLPLHPLRCLALQKGRHPGSDSVERARVAREPGDRSSRAEAVAEEYRGLYAESEERVRALQARLDSREAELADARRRLNVSPGAEERRLKEEVEAATSRADGAERAEADARACSEETQVHGAGRPRRWRLWLLTGAHIAVVAAKAGLGASEGGVPFVGPQSAPGGGCSGTEHGSEARPGGGGAEAGDRTREAASGGGGAQGRGGVVARGSIRDTRRQAGRGGG